jgi:hypothetical protein
MALVPLRSTPKVVSRGTVTKPVAPPTARMHAPLLAKPVIVAPPALPHQKGSSGAGKGGKKS